LQRFFEMNYLIIFDSWDNIFAGLFAVTILIQLIYYLFVYLRVAIRKDKQDFSLDNETQPVSVIICARNEDGNLAENLAVILEQDYPLFEVIVVNDCSEDSTEQMLAEFKKKYPHLRSTIIKKDGSFLNFRKFATTVGIKAAKYEWLLFTYADCRPESKNWISSMSKYFVENKDIVLGYCGYQANTGFFNKFMHYDAFFSAFQHLSFAIIGKPYSGNGRNLAYRKSLFFAHSGFALHAHVVSDDDGLFVNKAAKKRKVAIVTDDESLTRANVNRTFKEWMWQKSKQIASAGFYSAGQSIILTLEPASRIFMWLLFVLLTVVSPIWCYALALLALRQIVFVTIIRAACKKFKERGILSCSVLFDFIMPFVHLYLFLLNKISKKYSKWN